VINMLENPWFQIDDPDDESGFDAAEPAFAAVLHEHAGSWTAPPADRWVARPEDASSLLAVAGLSDNGLGLSLVGIGVNVTGSTVRGDRVHIQPFFLPDQPTDLATRRPDHPGHSPDTPPHGSKASFGRGTCSTSAQRRPALPLPGRTTSRGLRGLSGSVKPIQRGRRSQ
jgi:hypothetical protein